MLTKSLAAISIFILALAVNAFAQIKVTSEKITYQRTGENVAEYKKTFEVNYPRFSGVDPENAKRLEWTFDYWRAFDASFEEERESQALDSLDFRVKYNDSGIIVLDLYREGSGASVSSEVRTIVADKFGNRIRFTDVFKNRIGLLAEIDKKQAAEMKLEEEKFKRQGGEGKLFEEEVQKASDQVEEFFVDDFGVTFKFDYAFPRVSQALQPEGEYFFSWKEIKPFLREYSSLADLASRAPAIESIVPILELRIGGVLGGVSNGKFVNGLFAAKAFAASVPVVLFDPGSPANGITIDKYRPNWNAKLASEQSEDICPDFRYAETNPAVKKGIAIGHGGKWNPVPRPVTEIAGTNAAYRQVVAEFL